MKRSTMLLAATAVVALALPFVVKDAYWINLAVLALMAAQAGAAWNLVGGYAGQASLGHAAFYGIGAACAGAAGALLSTFFPIFPEVGANFILIAFVVVNLGGFGSVAGAFWAGILVGVIEVMGGLLLGPQYKMAIVLALFLAVLMFRPQGLMGKAQ